MLSNSFTYKLIFRTQTDILIGRIVSANQVDLCFLVTIVNRPFMNSIIKMLSALVNLVQ